ncbi:MAG: GNAT family N-acetyltransferase [Burkholderiaceae bacterium]
MNPAKPPAGQPGGDSPQRSGKPAALIFVKTLAARARPQLLKHFLALGEGDRLLRFGSMLSDELVARYVNGIDFRRDTVFGVYNGVLKLVGVGHLAFAPTESMPGMAAATAKQRIAELGVSVDASARGIGVGSRLVERAAMHCRNEDVDTLTMHCLSSNQVMMHIARKAGMEIHREYGEADAYLKLPPADPSSVMQEAIEEQAASLDYTFKAQRRFAVKWLRALINLRRR